MVTQRRPSESQSGVPQSLGVLLSSSDDVMAAAVPGVGCAGAGAAFDEATPRPGPRGIFLIEQNVSEQR